MEKMYTIGKAAKYLGISRDTLRRWEKKGKLRSLRTPSNYRVYTQEQLERIKRGEDISNQSLSEF